MTIQWMEPRPVSGAILSSDHLWMLYPLSNGSAWWAIRYSDDEVNAPTEQIERATIDEARAWCESRAAELAAARANGG